MTVTVRLFAVLRERAGKDSIEMELEEGATVAEALDQLSARPELADLLDRLPLRMAVNRDYADPETRLASGDELALVPPVSGGGHSPVHVRITDQPLSLESLSGLVSRPVAGAIVSFQGTTREVTRLDYEAYREMAEERIGEILRECIERHRLAAAAAEHRIGPVPLGESSVIVSVSAAHREEAFSGARAAIDRIKAEAPIWKREVETTGEGEAGRWVEGAAPPIRVGDGGLGALSELPHLDDEGAARMVDVGAKEPTERSARAEAVVRMSPGTVGAVARGDSRKGDVVGTARLAGIQAAKRTDELIPLAHPLALTYVGVEVRLDEEAGLLTLTSEARTVGQTGVEMEAMTACAVAALTVYDMVKGIERGVAIERIVLLEKSGGRSGEWRSKTESGGHDSTGR